MSDRELQHQLAVLFSLADGKTCRQILEVLGHQVAQHELQRAEQCRYAEHLQQTGLERRIVVERLVQRFGISQSTAYERLKNICVFQKADRSLENCSPKYN